MKPIKEWTEANLQRLCDDKEEEAQELEFKDGRALAKAEDVKAEMAKDVSGMANASGGLIIYGISEKSGGIASKLMGADPGLSVDWVHQVLDSGISPSLQGIEVRKVPLTGGTAAFLVQVPQAVHHAPHQASKLGKYFRRYGRELLPMKDHEIRDVMRRSQTPVLDLKMLFKPGTDPDEYWLQVFYFNESPEPALYSQVHLTFDVDLGVPRSIAGWDVTDSWVGSGRDPGVRFLRNFYVPNNMPIFQGAGLKILDQRIMIGDNKLYPYKFRMLCPGFADQIEGEIIRSGGGEPRDTRRVST